MILLAVALHQLSKYYLLVEVSSTYLLELVVFHQQGKFY